jgi:hypothetical protein
MPVLHKSDNCRGCGSKLHKFACCPNRPCVCCGLRHDRGVLDCPIYKAAKAKCVGAVAANQAVSASAAVAAVSDAHAAANAITKPTAAQSQKEKAAAKVARLQKDTALFRQMSAEGSVQQHNRSYYTKDNWAMTCFWACPVCRGTATFCICSERV